MKYSIFLLVCIMLIFLLPFSVFASTIDRPVTGNTLEYCRTNFDINDETNGALIDIKVLLNDITGSVEYDFVLLKEHDFNSGRSYDILANTTYIVSAFVSDGYEIVNADGTPLSKVAATSSGLTLSLILREANTVSLLPVTNIIAETPEIEQGLALFAVFRNVVNQPHNEYFLNDLLLARAEQYFVDKEYGSSDDWAYMSAFDKVCWWTIYLKPCYFLESGERSQYFGSETAFYDNFLSTIRSRVTSLRLDESLYDAFYDLLMWQYNYIETNNNVYNFMTNAFYLQSQPPLIEPDVSSSALSVIEQSNTEPPIIIQDDNTPLSGVPTHPERLKDAFSRNLLSIIITVIIVSALGIIIYRRSKIK